jgi:integrase
MSQQIGTPQVPAATRDTEVFTAKSVENYATPPARVEVRDALVPGLRLVVQPSGAKSWAVRYSFATVKKKLTLGTFPALGLAAARDAARKALEQNSLGIDPANKDAASDGTMSVKAAADLYTVRHVADLRNNTRGYVERELATLTAALGNRSMGQLRRRDLIPLIDAANGPHASNQRSKVFAAFFNWAMGRDMIDASPAAGLKKIKMKSRERFLDDGELRLVWAAADKAGRYGAFAKLLILSGCRRNEIARLEWAEIQGDYIVLNAERTKTGEVHHVFISPLARSIIEAQPRNGRYVLGNGRPMSANMRAKDQLDVSLNEDFRFHDLRRSFATGLQRLGIPIEIIERCLNHKLPGISQIYNRHDYSDEMRDAFTRWSTHVAALVV